MVITLLTVEGEAHGLGFGFWRTLGADYRGTATPVSQASGASIILGKPAGVVALDVFYAFVWTNDYDRTASVNTLSGWTLLGSQSHQTNQYILWVFRRVADGTEGSSFTFSFSESVDYAMGVVVAYGGANTNLPEGVGPVFSAGNVASSTVTVTGITTIDNHSRVLLCMIETSRASTLTAPPGYTQRAALVDTTRAQSIYIYDNFYLSPQATGGLSTTGWNTSTNRYLGAVISLTPR